ncbi:MAG: ABC transporter permease subunit [Gammaproteobacteria bacterium]|nr:MAG: ABC transporter permease subunit [Gammaproteobacteria bacterium]TLZ39402.1 MAG: ABC transporter permease subunit [Gammaproteobacteria bacterium]
MLSYALRRIAGTVPTLLVIISVSFCVVRLAPGGPFAQEQALPPPVRANLERLYGLDEPLTVQYAHYLRGLLRGDFGPSLRQRDFTVSELIAQGLPLSATLGLAAILLAVLTGVPAGILAALWRNRAADYCITTLAAVALALPSFVTGPLFALLFGLYLRWLPVAGWQHGAPRYLVLPVLTLALPVAAYLARLTRASLLEVLAAHYVLSARARGLGAARVLWRHALRPALMPVVSYLGPAVAFVMTGSLVVETVFGLPGTGRYLVEGAIDRDYPLVMGMVVVYGALTLLLNLIADLIYGALDPGVRRE